MVPELEQELMVLESVLIVPERAQMEQMIARPLATSDCTNSASTSAKALTEGHSRNSPILLLRLQLCGYGLGQDRQGHDVHNEDR